MLLFWEPSLLTPTQQGLVPIRSECRASNHSAYVSIFAHHFLNRFPQSGTFIREYIVGNVGRGSSIMCMMPALSQSDSLLGNLKLEQMT